MEYTPNADQEISENEQPILQLEDVTIRYGDVPAVQNVSLAIARQQITSIIGPSGCGKSTLPVSYTHLPLPTIYSV